METTKIPSVKREKIDPSIESALPENCTMSILFQEDGLIFSILRNDLKKFIVLGEYEIRPNAQIDSLFNFKEQLQGNFAHSAIGYQTSHFTIVPAPLFKTDRAIEYANFQFDKREGKVIYDVLSTHGLVVVYAIPQLAYNTIAAYFPDARVHHAASYTISHYLNLYKNKPGEHLHAQIWRNRIELIAIKNGKLLLYNTFSFETKEDLLYFVLNIYEQLGLNPESVPLKISGEIEKGNPVWELLLAYIRFVETEDRLAQYTYSHEFKAFPDHQFNRVYQAATCVL